MMRQVMKSRVVGATVTLSTAEAAQNGRGLSDGLSIGVVLTGATLYLDREVLKRADLWPNERVEVQNIDNGAQFSAVVGEAKPGQVVVVGGTAHLARSGHRLDIVSYSYLAETELSQYRMRVVVLGPLNRLE